MPPETRLKLYGHALTEALEHPARVAEFTDPETGRRYAVAVFACSPRKETPANV